ncbi:hypothetical protein PLCT1_00032 [Planctomycetaceae bacterium]|nr:hypothetical protein PLCT1_00032 [Planctomycetaceae bacterium]
MRSSILRPALVLILGLAALSLPEAASAGALVGCNQSFSADCENKSINDIRLICDVVCPEWTFATCETTGDLTCYDYPI